MVIDRDLHDDFIQMQDIAGARCLQLDAPFKREMDVVHFLHQHVAKSWAVVDVAVRRQQINTPLQCPICQKFRYFKDFG